MSECLEFYTVNRFCVRFECISRFTNKQKNARKDHTITTSISLFGHDNTRLFLDIHATFDHYRQVDVSAILERSTFQLLPSLA